MKYLAWFVETIILLVTLATGALVIGVLLLVTMVVRILFGSLNASTR